MTSVFSGGFVFEYSQEVNGFGLVALGNSSGSSSGSASASADGVQQLDGYQKLKDALAKSPVPNGDGGYKASSMASDCPTTSQWWVPQNSSLPVLPAKAADYFKNGAGPGQGNSQGTPRCSHFCGTQTTGLGKGDGATGGSSGGKKSAADAVTANSLLALVTVLGLLVLNV
jgi:hypothetical protein